VKTIVCSRNRIATLTADVRKRAWKRTAVSRDRSLGSRKHSGKAANVFCAVHNRKLSKNSGAPRRLPMRYSSLFTPEPFAGRAIGILAENGASLLEDEALGVAGQSQLRRDDLSGQSLRTTHLTAFYRGAFSSGPNPCHAAPRMRSSSFITFFWPDLLAAFGRCEGSCAGAARGRDAAPLSCEKALPRREDRFGETMQRRSHQRLPLRSRSESLRRSAAQPTAA